MAGKFVGVVVKRRLLVVLVGYFAVLIFILSFLVAGKAHLAFGLSKPLSETAVLTIATLLAIPVLLPFIWERITKLKVAGVEIDLSQVAAKVGAALTDELRDVERLAMGPSAIPNLTEKLATAVKEAESSGIVEVDIGSGHSWWSTRLFLLAALAEEYTRIQRFMFLEERNGVARSFVGMANPRTTRLSLAAMNSDLEKFYQQAVSVQAPDDARTLDSRVAWIAQNYVWQFNAPEGEKGAKEWVTNDFLARYVDIEHGIKWDGGRAPTRLLSSIVDRPEPFVPLIRRNGELDIVVDRQALAEEIARNCLRDQIPKLAPNQWVNRTLLSSGRLPKSLGCNYDGL